MDKILGRVVGTKLYTGPPATVQQLATTYPNALVDDCYFSSDGYYYIKKEAGWVQSGLLQPFVNRLTPAEYSALVGAGTVDPNKLYVIEGASDMTIPPITKAIIAATLSLTEVQLNQLIELAKITTVTGTTVKDVNITGNINVQ